MRQRPTKPSERQRIGSVSLDVAPGEFLAIVGPSGCGKSTLLELVCGLLAPDAGTVAAPPAALMPQRDGLLPWLSALDNAGLARRVNDLGAQRGLTLRYDKTSVARWKK